MAFTVTTSIGGVLSPKNLPLFRALILLEELEDEDEDEDEDEEPARCLLALFCPLPGLN